MTLLREVLAIANPFSDSQQDSVEHLRIIARPHNGSGDEPQAARAVTISYDETKAPIVGSVACYAPLSNSAGFSSLAPWCTVTI